MVRLQQNHHSPYQARIQSFNPTMVRLQHARLITHHLTLQDFQSHYGAIATRQQALGPIMRFIFQSHYGAIATRQGHRLRPTRTTFNPTMVRLQQAIPPRAFDRRATFNPTMVRLQPLPALMVVNPCANFQSHYGAIAT